MENNKKSPKTLKHFGFYGGLSGFYEYFPKEKILKRKNKSLTSNNK